MEVKVILEKNGDGTYSAFMEDIFPSFGLAGYGATPEEAINDFYASVEDTRLALENMGKAMPELTFSFTEEICKFTVAS